MKEGSLFVFLFVHLVEISQAMVPLATPLTPLESPLNKGALSWFRNVSTYGGEVIEY
jgi:hypothetical protein